MRPAVSVPLLAVLGATGLAGCASVDELGAGAVAQRFVTLAQSDPRAACALLAPQTAQHLQDDGGSCPKGLQDAQPPRAGAVRSVTVAINSAQVVMGNQGLLLLAFVLGQAVSGLAEYNETARTDGLQQLSFLRYVTSSSFAVDLLENWQSEYLQFTLYILLTVWLVQRGSSESKKAGEEGRQSDEEQLVGPFARRDSPSWARRAGWRSIYSHSSSP